MAMGFYQIKSLVESGCWGICADFYSDIKSLELPMDDSQTLNSGDYSNMKGGI